MLPCGQKTSTQVFRKVVGLVLIIPLLAALMPIPPIGLGSFVLIAAVAGSIYGAWYARQHAGRGLAIGAAIIALLNLGSLVALSTPSIAWFVYLVSWVYGSGNWIHWRL